ncbi:MAG: hypothetical protein KatS3mg129_2339 [Leptospiraceae bacterium]|nr:MAG: hypothetical protein KatS3mg129_2339 [Leptospiraceae bacterium]
MLKYIRICIIMLIIIFNFNCYTSPNIKPCFDGEELFIITYLLNLVEDKEQDELNKAMLKIYLMVESSRCKKFNDNPRIPRV